MYAEMPFGEGCLEADPLDVLHPGQHGELARGQFLQKPLDAGLVVGNVLPVEIDPAAAAVVLIGKDSVAVRPDPLHSALGGHRAIRHIIQFEFEGGAPHIAHKYVHSSTPPNSSRISCISLSPPASGFQFTWMAR